MSRSAVKYGSLQYNGLKAKINFNSYSELSFNVDKALCSEDLWGKLVDFKLIWVKDWNACFEINVDINEDNGISKTITAKSLGESELAQVNLYNIEVNTEDDIERSDYVPTILYNEENHKASLIHRLLEKCPHYRIGHIDSSIAGAQRTFQFNNQSILDAFDTISKEIDCAFIINCSINAEGDLVRTINIYDLEFSCVDCGHRWEHIADTCPSCNGTNINTGYGEDTHIFISSKNLAQQINYTTSTGSVKNCFKLQAGDDLMTSAVINCNPNGGQYLWYISDEVKEDMSDELSQKIDEYEDLCEYYQNEYQVDISSDDVNNYNRIIQKYSIYSQDHEQISLPIVGYSDLVKNLYNVLDFDIYLSNELMPTSQMINTTAEEQVAKLTTQSLSPVSVTDLSNLSLATANNVVLGMARVIVDNRYKITIVNSTLSNNTWQGSFCVTNYSNDDDTSTSGNINITINDDYENFLKQKIDKALQKSMTTNEAIDIVSLFKLGISDFTNEIKKYSLSILKSFYDNCQTCLDVLIEQGIANGETWGDKSPNLYTELYIPYRNKLTAIESEIALRESEVNVVKDIEDYLYDIKGDVQASLNLQAFLGDTLWEQFSAYRREDTYQNDNYISDGLGNSEMFEKAKAFIAEAQKNIYKSANLQHSISSTLKNLLMLREFQSLKDYFEEGNWLRIETDGEINRLRLMSYEVDYENTNDLSVEFSDVSKLKDGISDIQSVLDNSKSIASSFNAVTRQAKNGNDSRKTIDKWINSGIALNNIKIIQDTENQNVIFDNNGILCREYLPMIDGYDERQLKIINKGLFLTDDNWQSAKVGIGEIEYNGDKSYGVNAQLLIGDIIIGNELHIKDSQGQDIMTVIDGRISTEVTEVKSAAAAGTYEYYDPDNSSWSEKNNVDFFGYGISQDEKETDTGIKAAGNNNKYFLNKHNGNLYKSNGTKWVFQKTLSPRFNNYSTIAYTDNKSSTAESNAIANATNQVSTAKATIASSTLKYDETGITVDYYGYGVPTEIAGATQGKIYLDQNDGYYYTKGSGSNWTKSSSALPLYADQKANTAKSEAISAASADATQKANQAEENAIANATNQVNNATTTIANAVSKYDTTGLTISYYGYGTPDISTATSGQKYLDQNTGFVYTKNSGSGWTKSTSALTLITTKVATDAANDATTKANNAISTAATDATTKANTAENNAKNAAANAMSKYDEGSLTINYYGFGAPTTVAGSSQGEIYLDQNTGYYYTKGSGSTWTKSTNALPLYADQKATEAYNNALSYVSTYYITSEDVGTAINQTKQEIEMTAAKAVNKYEVPAGITINFAGYGDPTTQGAKATAANQYYLDQETGNLYKSNSSKQWGSTPTQTLTLITSNLNSKIDQTAENVTISVEKTIAESTQQYFKDGIEIKYYGYGAPSANITDAEEGDRYLDQATGYYYTKGSDSTWTKSEEPLELYAIATRDAAVRMAGQETARQIGEFGEVIGEYLEEDFYTKTETKAEIKNDGEKISLEAVRNTVGYTIQSALETKLETATVNGLTLTRQSDGSYIVNGTCGQAGAGFWLTTTDNQQPTSISQNAFKTGQYLIKASGAIPYAFTIWENGVPKQWATIYDVTVTVDNADEYTNAFYLGFSAGTYDNLTINPLVYKATEVKQTVSSQLSVMADNISLKVNKNDLVSEINLSTDEIVLKGNRIRITDSSDTTKTLISGSVIQSGNYAVSSGVVTGTRIDLGNGAIYSKNFEINSSGNLTLSGGVIKTSNYTESTANTKTVGGKINLNVGSTSSDYLFDTANFKITGTGAVVATEANLNSCTINGGRFKVNTSSSLDETSYIDLRNQYTYTYSSGVSVDYSYFTAIQPAGTTMGSEAKYSNDTFTTYYYANFSPSSIGLNSYEFDGQTRRNEENTIISPSYVLSPVIRSDKYYIGGINSSSIALQEIAFSGSNAIAVGVSSTALRLACTESYIDGSLNFYKYNTDSQDYGSITFGNKIALRYWGQNESFCVGISDKKLQFYGTNVLMPSGAAVTSDARKKHNIESLDSRYLDIIKNIEPKRFQYNCNPLDRYHTGYIAQDVEKAMQNIGMDVSELSAFVDTNNDGTEFALRYGEFIPLLHKWIKEIDDRLTAIERKERNEY